MWTATGAAALSWYLVGQFPMQIRDAMPFTSGMFRESDGLLVMSDMWQSICYLGAGVIAGVATALLTRPQPAEQLDQFFTLLRTPVKEGEEVTAPCTVPEDNQEREPVIEFGGFQFPKPTRLGVGGFCIAWALVFGIVGLTKLLSLVV